MGPVERSLSCALVGRVPVNSMLVTFLIFSHFEPRVNWPQALPAVAEDVSESLFSLAWCGKPPLRNTFREILCYAMKLDKTAREPQGRGQKRSLSLSLCLPLRLVLWSLCTGCGCPLRTRARVEPRCLGISCLSLCALGGAGEAGSPRLRCGVRGVFRFPLNSIRVVVSLGGRK